MMIVSINRTTPKRVPLGLASATSILMMSTILLSPSLSFAQAQLMQQEPSAQVAEEVDPEQLELLDQNGSHGDAAALFEPVATGDQALAMEQ
jgi:methionine-rich copper-binding protein CopC